MYSSSTRVSFQSLYITSVQTMFCSYLWLVNEDLFSTMGLLHFSLDDLQTRTEMARILQNRTSKILGGALKY